MLFTLTPTVTLRGLRCGCRWRTSPAADWDTGSGERLDAVLWEGREAIVAVGTEDGEALHPRLPHCGFSIEGDPFGATRGAC